MLLSLRVQVALFDILRAGLQRILLQDIHELFPSHANIGLICLRLLNNASFDGGALGSHQVVARNHAHINAHLMKLINGVGDIVADLVFEGEYHDQNKVLIDQLAVCVILEVVVLLLHLLPLV